MYKQIYELQEVETKSHISLLVPLNSVSVLVVTVEKYIAVAGFTVTSGQINHGSGTRHRRKFSSRLPQV